ncbi:hypothetical protein EQV77_09220 [Halobacillus fulvus]|nr:hypothetical protein EQV77_09220 [Halobacillus fulvus]
MILSILILLVLGLAGVESLGESREYFIGPLLLLFVYLSSMIHFKKTSYSRSTAVLWAVLFPGFGQLYLKQRILGLLLSVPFLYIITTYGMTRNGDERFLWAMMAFSMVSVIFASMTKVPGENEPKLQKLQTEAVEAYKSWIPYLKKGAAPALDTNMLMHSTLSLVALYRDSDAPLYISRMVLNELDGLKKNNDVKTRKKAQLGFDLVEMFQQADRVKVIEVPAHKERERLGVAHDTDSKIIASYIADGSNVFFLSNDKGARITARNTSLDVFEEETFSLEQWKKSDDAFRTGKSARFTFSKAYQLTKSRVRAPGLYLIKPVVITGLAVWFGFSVIFSGDSEAVANEDHWEQPELPFEELEVTAVELDERKDWFGLTYVVINHGDAVIRFGHNEGAEGSIQARLDAVGYVFKDGSEKEGHGIDIEPKQKVNIHFMADEPLRNLESISASIHHEGTGETREWRMADE